MHTWIEAVTHWLRRVVTQPREELDRWQTAVRFAYDLGRFGARQLKYDRATEMAAALSFRTLFGLLPVLVVTTVLVKALGMEQHFLQRLESLFAFWGLDDVHILLPETAGGASATLSRWLCDRVQEAESINLAAIGWVGVALTVYAAISLVVTVEDCFNTIYRAAQGRSWFHRVPMYWFVLTLSPVLVVAGTYADGWFGQHLEEWQAYRWLTTVAGLLWSLFAIWLLMVVVYRLFPNTEVRLRPAMAGAFVAAVLLEIGKRTMGMYLQNALSLSQLYGSLGLIPLFMFWVYLMWLAVLFGLEVSATLQLLHGRQVAELEERRWEPALVDPGVVIALMERIGARFLQGRPTSVEQIIGATGLPQAAVERLLAALVEAGVLHRLADAAASVTLSRPPEDVPVEHLLDIAFQAVDKDEGGEASFRLREHLRSAQKAATGQATLRSLLDTPATAGR